MTSALPSTVRRRTLALLVAATVASSAVAIAARGTEPSVAHETHTTAVRAANAASFRPVQPPAPDVDGALRDDVAALKAAQPQPEPEPVEEPAAPPPPPAPPAPVAATGSVWDRLAMCESSGNWASSVGTYEGGLQFHPSTWDAYKPAGYPEAAYQASREQQIHVAEKVLARQGWGAWPACSRKLGLR